MGAARRGADYLALRFSPAYSVSWPSCCLRLADGGCIEACRTVGELETCRGQASPRQVLGMLAWHVANVVPVLDSPTHWNGIARPALPMPSSGRPSSLSVCGLR